jgi:hypothetical protein
MVNTSNQVSQVVRQNGKLIKHLNWFGDRGNRDITPISPKIQTIFHIWNEGITQRINKHTISNIKIAVKWKRIEIDDDQWRLLKVNMEVGCWTWDQTVAKMYDGNKELHACSKMRSRTLTPRSAGTAGDTFGMHVCTSRLGLRRPLEVTSLRFVRCRVEGALSNSTSDDSTTQT